MSTLPNSNQPSVPAHIQMRADRFQRRVEEVCASAAAGKPPRIYPGNGSLRIGPKKYMHKDREERRKQARNELDREKSARQRRSMQARGLGSPLAVGDQLLRAPEALMVIYGEPRHASGIYRLIDVAAPVIVNGTPLRLEVVHTPGGMRFRKGDCERFATEFHRLRSLELAARAANMATNNMATSHSATLHIRKDEVGANLDVTG